MKKKDFDLGLVLCTPFFCGEAGLYSSHQPCFWNHPEGYVGQNAILVVGQGWEIDEMMHRFDKVEPLEDFPVFRNGIDVQRYRLFRGINFKG
ncbi:MAG: hypothetical protein HY203_07185 [Nitrospirae bacterium]|nr:hypothetical protein [Nitrospirota bacterium]